MGSRDRKMISQLCYAYFRTALALKPVSLEEKIIAALFISSSQPSEMLQALHPEWNRQTGLTTEEKLRLTGGEHKAPPLFFPCTNELGTGIDAERLSESCLVQPPVYLRLRPGQEIIVAQQLQQAAVPCRQVDEHCIAVDPGVKLETILQLNKTAVIQDYSSQQVGRMLQAIPFKEAHLQVWDCCAASGGKSILATDLLPAVQLTVSDIRDSILANLRKRFSAAGIRQYDAFETDLSVKHPHIPSRIKWEQFDLVLADLPCTGSGTWGRNPEFLPFFQQETIGKYAALQQSILRNIVDFIKPGGWLLYCTCSVFAAENEANLRWLQKKFHLRIAKMEYLKGYDKAADTLFAAILQKSMTGNEKISGGQ